MIPIRTSDAMIRDGFVTVPVPPALSAAMTNHVHRHIGEATAIALGDDAPVEELTEAVATLPDDVFVDKFKKPSRMFPDEVSKQVYAWVESLAKNLGGARGGINHVSPSERQANPTLNPASFDVFWRCVRPGKPDVGQPHADFQFWEIARGTRDEPSTPFEYDERWKIWLPLMGCDRTNSLEVIPASHAEDIPIDYIDTKNGTKPSIRSEWIEANHHRFMCPLPKFEHYCVLFHDKLVHRGTPNNTAHLRISGEFTILLKL